MASTSAPRSNNSRPISAPFSIHDMCNGVWLLSSLALTLSPLSNKSRTAGRWPPKEAQCNCWSVPYVNKVNSRKRLTRLPQAFWWRSLQHCMKTDMTTPVTKNAQSTRVQCIKSKFLNSVWLCDRDVNFPIVHSASNEHWRTRDSIHTQLEVGGGTSLVPLPAKSRSKTVVIEKIWIPTKIPTGYQYHSQPTLTKTVKISTMVLNQSSKVICLLVILIAYCGQNVAQGSIADLFTYAIIVVPSPVAAWIIISNCLAARLSYTHFLSFPF